VKFYFPIQFYLPAWYTSKVCLAEDRAFSHGCIRVCKTKTASGSHHERRQMESWKKLMPPWTGDEKMNVKNKIPVYIGYLPLG
jgi:murein L,D-transpeptidase YcbB/YkuD